MLKLIIRFFISIALAVPPLPLTAQSAADDAHSVTTAHQFNKNIEELHSSIFTDQNTQGFYVNHPLDIYSLIHQKTGEGEGPARAGAEKLLVEIINSEGQTQALISQNPVEKILNPRQQSLYTGSSWRAAENTLNTFQISYQGRVLNVFSNHVQWISFLGPYLVFFEPGQRYENNKAFISFIDLKYFAPALGKTALPIFRIPIHTTPASENLLLHPSAVTQTNKQVEPNAVPALILHGQDSRRQIIFLEHLHHLSLVQQTAFNIMVSLVSVDRYDHDFYPFLEEILSVFQKSARKEQTKTYSITDNIQPGQELIDFLSHTIKHRSGIGSLKDPAGPYSRLKTAQIELEQLNQAAQKLGPAGSQPPLEVYQKFTKHLEADQAFQTMLEQSSRETTRTKKILERIKGLYAYLTIPQPLGAPKIQEALGLIAGSVRKHETLENRFEIFKEGLSQIAAHKKTRIVGTGVLIGAAYFAHPAAADFYHYILFQLGQWFYKWGDLAMVTLDKSTAFLDPQKLHSVYIADGNYIPFAKGFSAMAGFIFGLLGSLHILINTKVFIQHLKSAPVQAHQAQAQNLLTRLIKNRDYYKKEFIAFTNQTHKNFIQNLSNIEWRKTGLKTQFALPGAAAPVEALFQTGIRWSQLLEHYKNQSSNIQIQFLINNTSALEMESIAPGQKKPQPKSSSDLASSKADPPAIAVSFHPPGAEPEARSFTIKGDGDFQVLFQSSEEDENPGLKLKDGLAMRLKTQSEQHHWTTTAGLIDGQFSAEEEQLIQNALRQVSEEEKQKSFLTKIIPKALQKNKTFYNGRSPDQKFSQKEITQLRQAVFSIFNYSHWTYTMSHLIKYWNQFFLFRNMLWKPSAGLRILYYSGYFDRIARQNHRATVLNGGYEPRYQSLLQPASRKLLGRPPPAKDYLKAVHQFEERIIEIERRYWKAAAEQGLLAGIEMLTSFGSDRRLGALIAAGVKQNPEEYRREYASEDQTSNVNLKLRQLKKHQRFFIEMYTRELFNLSMMDFIKQTLFIPNSLSARKTRNYILNKIQAKKISTLPIESMQQIRARVHRTAQKHQTADQVHQVLNKVFSFKRMRSKNSTKAERNIDPDAGLSMQRYTIAEESNKDPEALARVTRHQLAQMIVDKPIELAVLFLVLAGVDQGILKVLHKEAFNEEALFHLSRVAVWAGFVSAVVMDILGSSWMKVQIDARLGSQGLFSHIPKKEDIHKKFASLRAFYKGFNSPDNTLMDNYKYIWRILIANFGAAVATNGVIFMATLGRFDADLFLNAYLVTLFPLAAVTLKLENAFELTANMSLKDLMKKGLDFEKNKHWLAHPDIQRFKINQANKLRRQYNVMAAVFYNNPMENLTDIFANINTQYGTRFFQRQWLFGWTLTEYWVALMNKLEHLGAPSKLTKACKLIFTKNRTDLINE